MSIEELRYRFPHLTHPVSYDTTAELVTNLRADLAVAEAALSALRTHEIASLEARLASLRAAERASRTIWHIAADPPVVLTADEAAIVADAHVAVPPEPEPEPVEGLACRYPGCARDGLLSDRARQAHERRAHGYRHVEPAPEPEPDPEPLPFDADPVAVEPAVEPAARTVAPTAPPAFTCAKCRQPGERSGSRPTLCKPCARKANDAEAASIAAERAWRCDCGRPFDRDPADPQGRCIKCSGAYDQAVARRTTSYAAVPSAG